ncbi:MAG: cyclic nucleotide-binding domain-containing protein [Gammaproteobacteria bacterium]|nr:cyclic nucleotide-binding domain-containing protein [Gammaproteobacteria bacterium]
MANKLSSRIPLCVDHSRSGRTECQECGIRSLLDTDPSLKTAPELARLLEPVEALYCGVDTVIFREGEHAESAFIVRRGLLKASQYLPDGSERIVRLYSKGDTFGIERFLDRPCEGTVAAVNRVELCRVPLRVLEELGTSSSHLYRHLFEHWYSHIQRADTWITQFSTGSIKARVARLVRFLAELEDDAPPGHVALLHGEEMAAILGVTQESVSRVLAELKRKGVLQLVPRNTTELYSYDTQALSLLAADH